MTTAIPDSPSALREWLTIDNGRNLKETVKTPAELADVMDTYGRQVYAKDPDAKDQIREQFELFKAEFLANYATAESAVRDAAEGVARLNLDPNVVPGRRSKLYNRNAPGRAMDKAVSDWGTFMKYAHHKTEEQKWAGEARDARASWHDIMNSFGTTVPSDGGFLVPERLRAELLRVSLEQAVMRRLARVVPMDSLTVPFPTVDSVSNASSVYGGIAAYWTEEGAELVESQARFGRILLQARKLTAYAVVPNELFQDAIISLEMFINEVFPEALAWFEDIAFLTGSGVGEPLGMMNAAATVVADKRAGQPADTIAWENIIDMYARLMPSSHGRAVWMANINTFPQLATMALEVGTGGSAIWLNNGVQGPPAMILGRPVIFTEKVPTVGDQGDLSLVDPAYYLIGDRQQMTAKTSEHIQFNRERTAMRFTQRVDGRPWIESAITPREGADTLSPFVQLAERA